MARQHRKRPSQSRKGRRQRRTQVSSRHGLKDAIGKFLPGQFFSRWRVAGLKWSPLRVFWVAILMVWSAEQTLQTRFEETREAARSLFPKWTLGKSYTGWYEAQLKWLTPLRPALGKRLRQQLRTRAGRHWRHEGWCAFTADGGQRKRVEVCGQKEDGTAIVRDDVATHGHGHTLGFSHRAGDGERTTAFGRDAGGFAAAVVPAPCSPPIVP